ncbi:unnamed protein product, partial [Rotaria socialis]
PSQPSQQQQSSSPPMPPNHLVLPVLLNQTKKINNKQ